MTKSPSGTTYSVVDWLGVAAAVLPAFALGLLDPEEEEDGHEEGG